MPTRFLVPSEMREDTGLANRSYSRAGLRRFKRLTVTTKEMLLKPPG
jgi:hypothetical protein